MLPRTFFQSFFVFLLATTYTLCGFLPNHNTQYPTYNKYPAYNMSARVEEVLSRHTYKKIVHYIPWHNQVFILFNILLSGMITLAVIGFFYYHSSLLFEKTWTVFVLWLFLISFICMDIFFLLQIYKDYYAKQHPGCILFTENDMLLMRPGSKVDEAIWITYKNIQKVKECHRESFYIKPNTYNVLGNVEKIYWLEIIPTCDTPYDVQEIYLRDIGRKGYEALKAIFIEKGYL